MIRLNNVSKTYARGKVKAVDGLSMHVRQGEIFGFIGPNGAGKTTTIKMITGLLKSDTGDITVNKFNVREKPLDAKRSIGYVPDTPEIYDRLSGIEYLNFIGDMFGVAERERRERTEKYLALFELADAAGDPVKSYSHGMKQKLVIISALLHNPPVWVLDEPLTGLDPKSAHLLKEEMRAHTQAGNTVFFSTHVLEVAEKLCDRVGIIDNGRLIAVGTIDELKSGEKSDSLESAFLSITEGVD